MLKINIIEHFLISTKHNVELKLMGKTVVFQVYGRNPKGLEKIGLGENVWDDQRVNN